MPYRVGFNLGHDRRTGIDFEDSILVAATFLLQGKAPQAIAWFRSERLSPFDGATAMQLVECGRGKAALQYLQSLQVGDLDGS